MNAFEKACREFALGRIQKDSLAGKPKCYREFLTYAYLGRLVLVIKEYQKTKTTQGPAIDQFIELAAIVSDKTGERVVDQIFADLSLLVDKRLDMFEGHTTVDERRRVSQFVATTVPI